MAKNEKNTVEETVEKTIEDTKEVAEIVEGTVINSNDSSRVFIYDKENIRISGHNGKIENIKKHLLGSLPAGVFFKKTK